MSVGSECWVSDPLLIGPILSPGYNKVRYDYAVVCRLQYVEYNIIIIV